MAVKMAGTIETAEPRAGGDVKELFNRVHALQEQLSKGIVTNAGDLRNTILNYMDDLSQNLSKASPADAARIASELSNLMSLMAKLTSIGVKTESQAREQA